MTKHSEKAASLSSGKKNTFIIATLLMPFLLVVILETCLRVFHYGPDLSLFRTETHNGTTYYTMNPSVGSRYFYQVQFSPYTSPEIFPVVKSSGTIRIFCLGASTTVGYPFWYNGAFSSFLRERLTLLFPQKNIEIINLGLTATNSFTVVDMARELSRYQPDLLICYDGHNEFYGSLGISSRESFGSSRWAVKLYLSMIHFKSFLLARDIYSSLASLFISNEAGIDRGTTMERLAKGNYIPYRSATYQQALDIFKENILELEQICVDNNIPLILSSQASNLRDLPPFISGENPGKTESENLGFLQKLQLGNYLFKTSKHDSALAIFRNLLLIDSLRADIHYTIGKIYDQRHDFARALKEYRTARDYDQLRFRASSDFNEVIRSLSVGKNIYFADIEQLFMGQSPDSITGNNLIFEHLHPKSRGQFLMAKKYAEIMRTHHLGASENEWNAAPEVNEEKLWDDRHITELDERLASRKVEILTAAWPFTQNTTPVVQSILSDDTLGSIVERILRNKSDWMTAHLKAAEFYDNRGEKKLAAKEYETIRKLIPYDVQPYLKEAKLFLELGELDTVKQILESSLHVTKTILAFRALGDIALRQNEPEKAVTYYEAMNRFPQTIPEQVNNGYLLALALHNAGMDDKSKNQLLFILQLKPDFSPAAELLSVIQTKKSKERSR